MSSDRSSVPDLKYCIPPIPGISANQVHMSCSSRLLFNNQVSLHVVTHRCPIILKCKSKFIKSRTKVVTNTAITVTKHDTLK